MRRVLVGALVATTAAVLALGSPLTERAAAAPGAVVTQIATGVPGSSVAFDGQHLYFMGTDGVVLHRVAPNGSAGLDVPITGAAGLNALAYDASRDAFWGVDRGGLGVYLMGRDGIARLQFAINPLTDLPGGCGQLLGCSTFISGLSYDAVDDSLWYAPQGTNRIYHLDSVGQPLGYVDVPTGSGCAPAAAGVAAGSDALYVSTNGCARTLRLTKQGSLVSSFATPAAGAEVECDDVSFSPDTVWTRVASDGRLLALEIQPNTCIFGGGVDFRPIPAWITGGGTTPARTFPGGQHEEPVIAHIGFRLNCPTIAGIPKPNRFTITWDSNVDLDAEEEHNRFHLDGSLVDRPNFIAEDVFAGPLCNNAGLPIPPPPNANFTFHRGTGSGRFSSLGCSAPGPCNDPQAFVIWGLGDFGEPGVADTVSLRVFAGGLEVLAIDCAIDGNVQAHGEDPIPDNDQSGPNCSRS